jgi:hypothetical protein
MLLEAADLLAGLSSGETLLDEFAVEVGDPRPCGCGSDAAVRGLATEADG